jgi:hypothetical protein
MTEVSTLIGSAFSLIGGIKGDRLKTTPAV